MIKCQLYTPQEVVNLLFETTEEMGKLIYDHADNFDFKTFERLTMTVVRFKSSMLEKLGFSEEDMEQLVKGYDKYKESKK